jgi:hypothetical protein
MVTQANGCTYVASPTSVSAVTGASSGSVAVTAGTGCTWTASSSASWLTVTSGASGSGNGSVGYAVAANTGAARSATLTVGGKTVTVNQAAVSCNYTLLPASGSIGAAGGNGAVSINAPTGCAWVPVSSASWLTVTSGSSGNGNGNIGYAAAANTGAARTATLTVSGTTFTVSQAAGCTYAVSPTSVSAASPATSGTVAVTSGPGCAWTAASNAPWLTVTAGASGSGNGSVGYAASANTGATRSASLTVGGVVVPVVQEAAPAAPPVPPTGPGLAPLASSAAMLDFGDTSMTTSSPAQSVTFTNTNATAVTVSALSTTTHFTATHNCATLAPGISCSATVTFTPNAEGELIGTLSITSTAGAQSVSLSGNGERSLVTHYYRSILRRAPDPQGKASWEAVRATMQSFGANVNESWYAIATSFLTSAEYRNFNRDDVGYVTDLYQAFLNRAPDSQGLADWIAMLAQGAPREVVATSFMFSAEFSSLTRNLFGNTEARKEIDTVMDFYRGLLSRTPDPAGFDAWLQKFRTAQCSGGPAVFSAAETISSQFINSPEYVGRARTNAQYVGDLYNAFLRRGGDLGGVTYWIGQLDSGAQTRAGVRRQFLASPEFNSRVNAIIAQGCLR